MDVKTRKTESEAPLSRTSRKRLLPYLLDAVIVLSMCGLLYYGASWQMFKTYTDAAKYQCYALAFWYGMPALHTLPDTQCAFITQPDSGITFITRDAIVKSLQRHGFPPAIVQMVAAQSPDWAHHALPHEYPLLTLIPFTLGLIGPSYWYQVTFAIWMALVAAAIYILLLRFRSRQAAISCALYMVAGAWATAVGRFDLIPSALTLLSLFCAARLRWNWAFALLALATLFKIYPIVLIIPFLIAQQRAEQGKWFAWQRWTPLAVFIAVCVVVVAISLRLSVEGTLAPLGYFGNRPVQVESLPASLIWLLSLLRNSSLSYEFTFGSLNVLSHFSSKVSLLATILLVAGLLYTWWLQWRSRIDLATASLLTILVIMITGKVFSPQYLIWVVPLVAYVGASSRSRRWWLIPWILIGALTTWIYPFIYTTAPGGLLLVPNDPRFYIATTARNLLLLSFILYLLVHYSRRRAEKTTASAISVPGAEDL